MIVELVVAAEAVAMGYLAYAFAETERAEERARWRAGERRARR